MTEEERVREDKVDLINKYKISLEAREKAYEFIDNVNMQELREILEKLKEEEKR